MDDNTQSPTRHELVRRIEERARLVEDLLAGQSEQQLTELRDPSGWSVKDHVVHLAPWALGMADLLLKRPRWLAMGIEREAWVSINGAEALNAVLFELDRERSLREAIQLFRAGNERLISAINQLESEEWLLRTYSDYQPFDLRDEPDPIWPRIVGNSFGHVDEHLGWIRDWLPQ